MYQVSARFGIHRFEVFATTLDRAFWAIAGYLAEKEGRVDAVLECQRTGSLFVDPYPFNVDASPEAEQFLVLESVGTGEASPGVRLRSA